MIPKIIHYCWFGHSPLPPLAKECITSWKKYMPEYEIKEWNESNFDVNMIPYTSEAYKAKKYAFVSDYARFWILYNYGGVYFDTDVELIKPINNILEKGAYMGFERDPYKKRYGLINPGLGMASEFKCDVLSRIMLIYNGMHFLNKDGSYNIDKTIVHYTTDFFINNGLKKNKGIQHILGFNIYPSEYFAPINFVTKRLHITPNTHSVHRYMASWNSHKNVLKLKIRSYLPEWILLLYNNIKFKLGKGQKY